jgi:hypothetical protein
MPNSTSYWCPWCLLSHSEWNKAPETFIPEARTLGFLSEMYLAVKNDADKKLKPTDRKGISCERHYKCLGPDNFVPPLLHLEIGMVNQVWEAFEEWVDAIVEIVPPFESDARTEVKNAKEKLELAIEEKKQVDAMTNIEIRDKSGTLKVIKAQLRRKNLENG